MGLSTTTSPSFCRSGKTCCCRNWLVNRLRIVYWWWRRWWWVVSFIFGLFLGLIECFIDQLRRVYWWWRRWWVVSLVLKLLGLSRSGWVWIGQSVLLPKLFLGGLVGLMGAELLRFVFLFSFFGGGGEKKGLMCIYCRTCCCRNWLMCACGMCMYIAGV